MYVRGGQTDFSPVLSQEIAVQPHPHPHYTPQAVGSYLAVMGESEETEEIKSGQVYTVDDAIEKMGFGPFQAMAFFFVWFSLVG